MPSDRKYGGIILAGGASTRMGSDKALLCHNGKTLLQSAVDVVAEVASNIVIVAATQDAYQIEGAKTIGDLYPGEGPVGGVVTGLSAHGAGCHVVAACDMPYLSADILRYLVETAKADPELDAVVPEIQGYPEPLCAVYAFQAIPKIKDYMDSGRRSARGVLDVLNVKLIAEAELRKLDPELKSFTNWNTPA